MAPWQRQALDRILTGNCLPHDRYWADPALVLSDAGVTPDPWQADVLRGPPEDTILLCSRQSGKTTVAAAMALWVTLLRPALVLLLSPSERQSGELAERVFNLYDGLGRPVKARKRTELQLYLANGSRVIALPGKEATIRGYSGAALLVIDEAARVPDDLYMAVRPMLAVSRGRLVVMSTPWGKRGFFHREWTEGAGWRRVEVRAEQCPRITPEFLARERAKGEWHYRQEYDCVFQETTDSLFRQEDIDRAFRPDVEPWRVREG